VGSRTWLSGTLALEESQSLSTRASPATGSYGPNPPLGAGTHRLVRLVLERYPGGIALHRDLQGSIGLEAGEGMGEYLRASGQGRWLARLGPGELLSRVFLGWGTARLPPYRSFVLGGRGTLVGEPYRAFGGRAAGLAHLEWQFDVAVPALSLGSFASTGHRLTVAPFVAIGYAGRPYADLPWTRSEGARPVAGLALEWFMRLIRVEAGMGLRTGHIGVTVDVSRDWWRLL
jgi:hypothetical protein